MHGRDKVPHLQVGDLLIRGGRLLEVCPGGARPRLADVTDELVGVVELVQHFKLSGLMVVTRWVRAGCPHVMIGRRRFFSLPAVVGWLAGKGYEPGQLRAGRGLTAARKRGKGSGWRKGALKPVAGTKGRGGKRDRGGPGGA